MSVTQSASVFACYDKACAPPPAGKGGSLPRSGSGASRSGGKTLDAARIVSWFNSFSHAGVTCRAEVDPDFNEGNANSAYVMMTFYNSEGKRVGSGNYTFDFAGLVPSVSHNSFFLKPEAQGLGIGRKFVEHNLDLYRKIGVKKVTIDATSSLWMFGEKRPHPMNGALVWGKVGFDFNGKPQKRLATLMQEYEDSHAFKWSEGLVDRVRSGKASIKEVIAEDQDGIFLNASWRDNLTVDWSGSILLDDVTITASASIKKKVSLSAWGKAQETALRPTPAGKSRTTTAVFACYSKACAPPPAGKGGSLKGGGTAPRTVGAGKDSSLRTSTNPSRVRVGSNAELGDASMRFRAAIQKESRGDSVFTKVLANERVTKALLEEDAFRKWFRSGERMSMSMVRRLGPAINDLAKTSIWRAAEKVLASKIENGEISDSQEVKNVKRLLDTNTNTAERIETLLQYMSPRDLTSVLGDDTERFVAAVMVRQVIDRWARGSTYGTLSFSQQSAAADVHGTPDAMKSYRKSRLAGAGNSVVEDSELMQAIVRAEYKVTQEWFKEQGITELRLHRGMTFKQSKTIDPPSNGSIVNVLMNPLSSWSHSFEETRTFGSPEKGQYGMIFSAIVPVELIQSIPLTGRGCLAEDEVIVIGAGGEASVSNVEYF